MRLLYLAFISNLFFVQLNAQGLINNGAAIVINGATALVYVDGDDNGNFVNQNDGVIDNVSGSMYVEGNWTNNAASSDVFINNTTSLGTVYLNGPIASNINGSRQTVFENINILNANRTLQINDCQTNGILTLNNSGLLLNANRFIANNNNTNAISVIGNGYIQSENTSAPFGELIWNAGSTTAADFIVPFGVGNTAAQKFDMVIRPTSGTIGSFTVATYPTAISNIPFPPTVTHVNDYTTGTDQSANTVDRFWKLEVSGSPTVDLTLNCQASEAPAPIASPLPQRWVASSTGWELPTNLGTPTTISNSAGKISGITNIPTWWTMASQLTPLPSNKNQVETKCINGKINVSWKTENNKHNTIYEVQTSNNGVDFITQENVFSFSNTNNYSVTLTENQQDEYVRVKIVELHGKTEYTNIVKAISNCNSINQTRIAGFNQLSNNQGILFVDVFNDDDFTLQIFDYRGRLLVNYNQTLNKGQIALAVDINDFSNSLYFANLIDKNGNYSVIKFQVMK